MDLAGMNIRKITDYFRAGCKEDYNRRIGVEIEHFVIKEDNTNATYEEKQYLATNSVSMSSVPC